MDRRRRSLDLALDEPPGPPGARAGSVRWSLEALWAQLEPLRPGLRVELLQQTDSTSTRLLERARGGDLAPCLLVAERQTAGRGRQGRPWYADAIAPDGGPGSLCLSVGLPFAPHDWSGLSLAVGVAVAEALHPRVRLKWPNDLWLDGQAGHGRKLGGVLIETVAVTPAPRRHAVIGLGINLVAPAPRADWSEPAACWHELAPQARAPDLLARVAAPLLLALDAFERHGFAAFTARFAARDALLGRAVVTTAPDVPQGIACGVDAHGALRVQTPAGTRLLRSGEVSVRPC